MNDITALAQRLKAAAEKATPGRWEMEQENIWFFRDGYTKHLMYVTQGDDVDDRQDHINTQYIAEVSPANVLELVEALEKAQQAANINNWWKPDVCPITGRRFFMWVEHPQMGMVPTYGGPFDSYTIPTRDSDGEFSCERYDHDVGDWVDGECVGAYLIDDDEQCRVYELEQNVSELREQLRTVELSNSVLESRTVTVKLPNPLMPAQHNSGELFMTSDNVRHGGYLNRDDVLRNLRAAGIQVIEGEQKNG